MLHEQVTSAGPARRLGPVEMNIHALNLSACARVCEESGEDVICREGPAPEVDLRLTQGKS